MKLPLKRLNYIFNLFKVPGPKTDFDGAFKTAKQQLAEADIIVADLLMVRP
jgi:hypothetical protein